MGIVLDLTNLLTKPIGSVEKFDIRESVQFPKEEIDLVAPIEGQITLTRLDNGIFANFDLKTKARFTCARCLKEFEKELDLKFEQEFYPETENQKEEKEEGNVFFFSPVKKQLDVTELIRQELILKIPIKPLCSPECQGIEK